MWQPGSHYAHAPWGSHSVMADMGWPGVAKSLKGVVLDMCGVLYDSGEGDGVAIDGSIEAVKKWVDDWGVVSDAVRDLGCFDCWAPWSKVHALG